MFVPWLISRASTADIRTYIAGGGREVEFDLGPHLVPGAKFERKFGHDVIGVEVRGSAVLGARAGRRGRSIFGNDSVPPFTLTAAADWEAKLVRGTFAMDVNLERKRWAIVAASDLWHLASMFHRAPAD